MTDRRFRRLAASDRGTLYSRGEERWSGFFVPRADAPAEQTLEEAWAGWWEVPGFFLFGPAEPTAAFLDRVADDAAAIHVRALLWYAAFDGAPQAVPFGRDGVAGDAAVALRNFVLNCAAGSSVALDGEQFVLGGGAIAFAGNAVERANVSADTGVVTFKVGLELDDAAFVFAYDDGSTRREQRYPLFEPGARAAFAASLDPVAAPQTTFTFAGHEPLASAYRTDFGETVTLTPLDDAALAFGACGAAYHLAPAGRFRISAPAPPDDAPNVLCGFAAAETLRVTDNAIVFYAGMPAYSPLFPSEPVDWTDDGAEAALLDDTCTTSWASIEASPAPADYLSQADDAPQYAADDGPFLAFTRSLFRTLAQSDRDHAFPIVPYARTLAGGFPADALLGFERTILAAERKRRIASQPEEKEQQQALRGAAVPVQKTTPQGFVVLDDNGSWTSLRLAQRKDGARVLSLELTNVDAQLKAALLTSQQFLVVSRPAREWTLDRVQPGQTGFIDHFVSIQGWPFDLRAGAAQPSGVYRNVLIFKFGKGRLVDRVAVPQEWTSGTQFNDTANNGLVTLSMWMQTYIADAIAAYDRGDAATKRFFARFVSIVRDPDWSGVLALNVDLRPTEMPNEVVGLLAGLDPSMLRAHHFGIEVTFVARSGGVLEPANSSLFGLINYVDPEYARQLEIGNGDQPLAAGDSGSDLRALTLRALFENSELAAFSSRLQLTINEWFGDRVMSVTTTAGPAPSASILLDGSSEKHNGVPVYGFNVVSAADFLLAGETFNGIKISKAQFQTQSKPADARAEARFTLSGALDFHASTGRFDALSFGSQPVAAGPLQGLAFANLFVGLTFPRATPALRELTFDASQMTFNAAQSSSPRRKSLFAAMPLQVRALLRGTKDRLPQTLGFLPITVDDVRVPAITGSWYGLQYDFDLGTAGSLSPLGLVASLAIVWTPSTAFEKGTPRFWAGLKLPGAGGGQSKLLSLQGVLGLSIGSLRFSYSESGDAPIYLLQLGNIALKVLVFKFPPGGRTLAMLFGNPDPALPRTNIGWYAAYKGEP